jgi:hypothetical protein
VRGLASASRVLVAASAFVAFAGAFAGIPVGARGAAGIAASTPAPFAARRATPFAVVLPHRDPFAGGDAPVGASASPLGSAPAIAAALVPAAPIPAALGPLPPNAGAGSAPFPFAGEGVHVRAVITGAQPFALVEDAGTTRLVTLGDGVAGDTIAAITADGVRLAHGRTIGVAPAAPVFPAGSGGHP